jgi:hypothetical protein
MGRHILIKIPRTKLYENPPCLRRAVVQTGMIKLIVDFRNSFAKARKMDLKKQNRRRKGLTGFISLRIEACGGILRTKS